MNVWELIIQQPLINVLIVVSDVLADNFGLAIIALTLFINLCMLPLTLSQIRSTKKMQEIQPKIAELQKKYGKDREKMAQEQMRIYKESGVKFTGCFLPLLIQMPVWIALYQSIILTLAANPELLLNLSRYLYPWPSIYPLLPINREFLTMDLANPNVILAVVVGVSMWVQQKMSMTQATSDPRQASQQTMMLWMMPMMFTLLALSFPSGLALYWTASNVFRIVLQYKITGWGGLRRQAPTGPGREKKGLKFETTQQKSVDDVGADIVISDTSTDTGIGKPSKQRYLPGRDRARRPRKK